MSELKACPFCGSEDDISRYMQSLTCYYVTCTACGYDVVSYSKDEAEAKWNTRPIEAALRAELAEAQYEIENLRDQVTVSGKLREDARKFAEARAIIANYETDCANIEGVLKGKDMTIAELQAEVERLKEATKYLVNYDYDTDAYDELSWVLDQLEQVLNGKALRGEE